MSTPATGAVRLGDCIEVMAELEAESLDAIVTDPPYGLEFMGKEWDRFRVDPRSARWASRSGNAGEIGHSTLLNTPLPVYTKRRMTSTCLTCGKRDAFRNPHACDDTEAGAEWRAIPVDVVNVELRAYQEWTTQWGAEAIRVAKPGAWLIAFGGTRTYHRLAAGLEDAGWEIRDCLVWGYASGFPKSLDVSKQLDKRAGAARRVTGERMLPDGRASRLGFRAMTADDGNSPPPAVYQDTAATSPEGIAWAGWGTALKPAWEPIVLARKPVFGTVADNVLRYGTGALNIDATRIPIAADDPVLTAAWVNTGERSVAYGEYATDGLPAGTRTPMRPGYTAPDPEIEAEPLPGQLDMFGAELSPSFDGGFDSGGDLSPLGRWPANILLTDPIFDGGIEGVEGGGSSTGPPGGPGRQAEYPVGIFGADHQGPLYSAAGTYSRFFLVPKADRAEREPVMPSALPLTTRDESWIGVCRVCGSRSGNGQRCGHDDIAWGAAKARRNVHPTVKPVELMRHLVRLITPPGGTVMDPFLGSGTTALAAEMEGFGWLGIERDPDYAAIAEARLSGVQRGMGLDLGAARPEAAADLESEA